MSIAEALKIDVAKSTLHTKRSILKIVAKHICVFGCSLLFCFAGVGDNFSPFAIAFACGVSPELIITATAGGVVGYFWALESVSALRYIATLLAMSVIMISLKSLDEIRRKHITRAVVVFMTLVVTGLAVAFADGIKAADILLCVSEGVLGGAAALVFSKTTAIVRNGSSSLSSKDATAVVVSMMILLLSIAKFNFLGIFPAHIIACVFVLVCSYYCGEAGGAIVGICAGITMSFGGGDALLNTFYTLGGLLCGAFSRFGKIACVFSFAFSGLAAVLISSGYEYVLRLSIETAASITVFFLITYFFGAELEKFLVPTVVSPVVNSVKSDLSSRLRRAADVSAEICTSVSKVNESLCASERKDCTDIIKKTKNSICGSCGLYDSCWKENFESSTNDFDKLLNLKRNGVFLDGKTVPQGFASSCIRSENICTNFNKLYSEYKVRFLAENRIREIQSLAYNQFANMSNLLMSLESSIYNDIKFDMDTAAQVKVLAADCGLKVGECVCVINNTDKLRVEIQIQPNYEKNEYKSFCDRICFVAKCRFNSPEKEIDGDFERIIFREQTEYRVVSAVSQKNSADEKFSGDSCASFYDDDGYFYAVICDGMGTGTRAAVTSAMAVSLLEKLIRGGFGIETSINTVNSCLISKSGDECSSTLDLLTVDLYTGHTEFYKCGAADTFIKHHGKIVDVNFSTMPLGIISETDVGYGSGTLSKGDVAVLCSDGVRIEDYAELRRQLAKFDGGSVKEFVEKICSNVYLNQNGRNDDITIMALAIVKNS